MTRSYGRNIRDETQSQRRRRSRRPMGYAKANYCTSIISHFWHKTLFQKAYIKNAFCIDACDKNKVD